MVQQVEFFNFDCRIEPDFIYNRPDLFCTNYIVLHVINEIHDYYLEVQLFEKFAILGLWMMNVSGEEFDEIALFLFKKYSIDYLSFYYTCSDRVYIAEKHYHVDLPDTYEELRSRLSAKSRNTMSRKIKKAEQVFGKIEMVEYENNINVDGIMRNYFVMKEKTHHVHYEMTSHEYMKKFHVSNIYALYFGDKIAAIILTCEQCPIAYLENLTFDVELSKYSPGMIAYEMVLERLILKRKRAFYLGGGEYDYKKKYDSIETIVSEGKIYKSRIVEMKYKLIDFSNKHLYWKIRYLKHKLFD